MPTALSSTDPDQAYDAPGRLAAARRSVVDVAILFRFRKQAVRRRHLARVLALVFTVVTLAVAVVPAFVPGAGGPDRAFDIFLLMPTARPRQIRTPRLIPMPYRPRRTDSMVHATTCPSVVAKTSQSRMTTWAWKRLSGPKL